MKSKLNFFVEILLMLVMFVGLIDIIFNISGWKFYLEIILLLALLFFSVVAMVLVQTKVRFGHVLSALIAAVALLNFLLYYFRAGMSNMVFVGQVAAITLFVVGVLSVGEKKPKIEKPVKTYTPGKVVASKNSKYYHIPKCDWAKKIDKKNQVWYDSDADARAEGLEPHNCA